MMSKLRDFDLYRRIPKDLTEATTHGSVLSICASLFMIVLFGLELMAFLTVKYHSDVGIDVTTDQMLRINFNITMLDLPCEYAIIDVVDVLGSRFDNVTKNINKWQIDSDGVRRNYAGRNREQRDILHDTDQPDIETLHENGVHSPNINGAEFDEFITHEHYSFVNFYAPWCIWCQRLEPIWEAFAEVAERERMPVRVVKVDCIENRDLCGRLKIQAFPMLKLFKDGVVQPPDYRSDRTVDAFVEFLKSRISAAEFVSKLSPQEKEAHLKAEESRRDDHPGCMMSGFLLVNRVPGNFHIEARSIHHNLNPAVSNMSHVVSQLTFGNILTKGALKKLDNIPDDYFSIGSTHPMNGVSYVNEKLHQAFHHYIKVVSTNVEFASNKNSFQVYQMVQSAQIMQYGEEDIPEARFSYDLSPMSVTITTLGKQWYEFVTSVCALIGGTFTIVGLLSGFLGTIFKSKKI